MRISDLVFGRVPAIISSETSFTYVAVRDAAEAIVRASEKRGNERGAPQRYRRAMQKGKGMRSALLRCCRIYPPPQQEMSPNSTG